MRMWGGWKGLPLAASHWPGMTTFSPEAASSFLLLSVHITPPSICVHLPLLLNSRHPHHNRSVSYSLAFWTRRRHCFGVFFFVFPFISTSPGCLLGASSFPPFLFSLFFTSYFSTSACPFSVLAGCLSTTCYLCPPPRPLQRSHSC